MDKISKENQVIANRIKALRERFKDLKIDGYIIPKNDEFFSEYAENDRLKNISKFTGSAGLAIILKKNNYLFVDGRYTIQAENESGKNFKVIEIHKNLPYSIIKKCKLGFDPHLFTSNNLKNYFSNNMTLIAINENLIDKIYKKKLKKTKPFFSLTKRITGESHQSKIKKITDFLKLNKADYLFISASENVAWLLNIRGHDNPSSPIPNSRLIIGKDKTLLLITEKDNVQKIITEKKISRNQVISFQKFNEVINNLKGVNFIIDNKSCSVFSEKIM